MRPQKLLLTFFFFVTSASFAQINIPLRGIISESFNSIGTSSTSTFPDNWKASSAGTGLTSGWTTGTNVTLTTHSANSGTPTAGGVYNWGTTPGTDRAIGFMTSGSYASPNSIMAYYRNATGATVTSITVSFQTERYRINTDPFSLTFASSTDGSTWTPRSAGDISTGVFTTGASSYTFSSPQTVLRTVTITGLNIANNGDFYLRWVFATGTASQGIGLDDVRVFAGTATPILSATLSDSISIDNSIPNQANAGDQLRYATKIKNTGTGDATGVQINIPAPTNTTLVLGSVKTSALARDDNFTTGFNNSLSGANVLTNDFGLPSLSIVSFGTVGSASSTSAGSAGTTDNGGTITVNADGSFTYTPPTGFTGNDRFAYIASSGTLPNNNAVVTIAVGTAATASADAYNAVGNVSISLNGAAGVLANDAGSNRTVIAVNGNTALVGTATTTTGGGNLTLNGDGSFIYNPPAGYKGSDNFTYTIDNGFSSPSTVTVTLAVSGMVWFINNVAGAGGDGRLSSPFNSTSAFNTVNNGTGNNPAAGDNIFIYESNINYNGSIALLNNQKLIGQDATSSLTSITGLTPPPYSTALPSVNGGNGTFATLTNAGNIITLSTGGGNLVQGMTLNATAGSALTTGASSSGTNTATDLITSVSGTANGVNLSGATGTFSYTSGSIINTGTGTAFNISGGSVAVTNSIAITQGGNGSLIAILNHATGAVTFQSGTLSATNGNGLQFTNADGTYNFNGTTTLNGGDAGIDILNGSGGTFSFSSNTSITNSSGTAFNVDGTTTTVTASVTYSGSITQNGAQRLVNINTTGSGTITFQTGTLTGGAASTGVNISAANGNVNFANLNLGTAGSRMSSQAITITGGTGAYSLGVLSVFTTGVGGLVASNADGTINGTSGTIDALNGTAINIGGPAGFTTLGITLTTVNSTGGTNNVSIVNCAGTANFGAGASSGATGTAFSIGSATASSGGTCSVSYAGTVTKTTAGRIVEIQNKTGGTVTLSGDLTASGASTGISVSSNTGGTITFGGSSKSLNTGASNAVTLATNAGTTINFTGGGLVIATTTGIGFAATGGATAITVTGTGNSINSISATALNVVSTTIGAGGLIFQNVSSGNNTAAADPVNGIVLSNTGLGGVTISGTTGVCTAATSTCTGGLIQNTTGAGVALTNASNISLNLLQIIGTGSHGITGTGVNNLSLTNSLVRNVGNSDGEEALYFATVGTTNITGTLTITNTEFRNFFENGLNVRNLSGALTINLSNSTFSDNDDVFGSNGLLVESLVAAGIVLNVTSCVFDNIELKAIQYEAEGTGTNDLNLIGNTSQFGGGPDNFPFGGGFNLIVDAGATMTFDVQGNYFNDIPDDGIVLVGEGNAEGRIGGTVAANQSGPGGANQGNTIRSGPGNNGFAGDGIRLDNDGTFNIPFTAATTWKVLIRNNYIDLDPTAGTPDCGDQGIVIFNRDHPGTMHVTVENNTVLDALNQGLRAFIADRDGAVTSGPFAQLRIANNSFTNILTTDAISISSDDQAGVCAEVTGNNNGAGGAPDGNIFLERRVASSAFTVSQASTAAISAANGGAPVTLGVSPLTFNSACSTLPPLNARIQNSRNTNLLAGNKPKNFRF